MNGIEKKLWQKSFFYIGFLRIVPFVRMISVCNNLAFSAVDAKSDIDLFIVAKTGRLFFVRTFITFVLQFLAVRRHGNKIAGRFCLSFFVDDSSLCLKDIAIENDIYLAYWTRSMVPLIDENNFSSRFFRENVWVKNYFENEGDFVVNTEKVLANSFFTDGLRQFFAWILGGRFGDFWEFKLRNWQLKRALRKSLNAGGDASLIVSEHMLKFHNIDRRKKYSKLWEEKFGNAKISDRKFSDLQKFL